jgi:hypothetical protein
MGTDERLRRLEIAMRKHRMQLEEKPLKIQESKMQ